jgi:hypothetical protein
MKTIFEKQIESLLDRKQLIDQITDGDGFTEKNRWLLEGVEVLLRSQLALIENLRDQGILR